MASDATREGIRITFEDVHSKQKKLRKMLIELANENRVLNDGERKKLQDLVGRACLGLEDKSTILIRHSVLVPKPRDRGFTRVRGILFDGSLAELITEATYMKEPVMDFSTNVPNYPKMGLGTFDISVYWEHILRKMENEVFPRAREKSIDISPERDIIEKRRKGANR